MKKKKKLFLPNERLLIFVLERTQKKNRFFNIFLKWLVNSKANWYYFKVLFYKLKYSTVINL